MVEATAWLSRQQSVRGKVPLHVVIAEGKRRGYCICPKPLRQLIDFEGLPCTQCLMPETKQSREFWYG